MIGALIGCIAGIVLALVFDINIPNSYAIYSGGAILAVLDCVIGALVSVKEKKFNLKDLALGIIFNSITAILLIIIGNLIGLELIFAVILWFGTKILKKISIIRKFLLNKCEKKVTIEEERLQKD